VYRLLLDAARAEGIGPDRLRDFLRLEDGGELLLLGQDELDLSVLEESLRGQVERDAGRVAWSPLETERILLAAARVGQHVFAQQVLANCGSQCVFCGLRPADPIARRMLLAGHTLGCIWRSFSTAGIIASGRSGLTACGAASSWLQR
jgi:putative restriction endonuclease